MISRTGACALVVTLFAFSTAFSPALAHAQDETLEPEIVVDWRVTEDIGTEFHVAATIHNRTNSGYAQWSIRAPFRHTVTRIVGAVSVQDESTVTISGTQPLLPGDERLVEMSVTSTGPVSRVPSTCAVAGTSCRIVLPWNIPVEADPASTDNPNSPPEVNPVPDPLTTSTESPEATQPAAKLGSAPADETQPSGEESPTATDSPTLDSSEPSDQPVPDDPRPEPGSSQDDNNQTLPPAQQRLVVSVATTSDWGTGQSVSATVRNEGPVTINEWSITIPWEIAVGSVWNAESTSGGGDVRVSSQDWNGHVEPNQAVEFGFTASPGASSFPEGSCSARTDVGPTECLLAR